MATGHFPNQFKIAHSILLHKPGKPCTDLDNYRPIALLDLFWKLLERCTNTRLRLYMEESGSFDPCQYGFRSHCSTQNAINIITDTIQENKRRRCATVAITKDVKKAFDRVWHAGLCWKLVNTLQLPQYTVKLIHHYLKDRKVYFKLETTLFNSFSPQEVVPQGSVLAANLFILYTNDTPVPDHPGSLRISYADDVTLLTSSPTN